MLKSNIKYPVCSWVPITEAALSCLCSSQKADKLSGVWRVNEQLQIRKDLLFYLRAWMKSFLHWLCQEVGGKLSASPRKLLYGGGKTSPSFRQRHPCLLWRIVGKNPKLLILQNKLEMLLKCLGNIHRTEINSQQNQAGNIEVQRTEGS